MGNHGMAVYVSHYYKPPGTIKYFCKLAWASDVGAGDSGW